MTTEQMMERFAALEVRNAALEAANATLLASQPKPKGLTLKVSAKGAVSVYGLGRWPVTLYASQMQRFLKESNTIEAFMLANKATLSVKEI